MLVQSVTEVFRVLVPSLASSVSSLGSNNDSQIANRTLTDVSSITTTLTSAVDGITGAASSGNVGNTAGAAVSGVADTVSSIASAFGRRLLHVDSSASGQTGRQLLQSTVRFFLYQFAHLLCCRPGNAYVLFLCTRDLFLTAAFVLHCL